MTLIKSVLSSIPLHQLAVLPVPKILINPLHGIFSNGFWSSNGEERHHWVSWETICCPKEKGGVRIHSLHQVMQALHIGVELYKKKGDSLWAMFMRSKYGAPHRAVLSSIPRSASHFVGEPSMPSWTLFYPPSF